MNKRKRKAQHLFYILLSEIRGRTFENLAASPNDNSDIYGPLNPFFMHREWYMSLQQNHMANFYL